MSIFGEIWTDQLGGVTGSVVKYVSLRDSYDLRTLAYMGSYMENYTVLTIERPSRLFAFLSIIMSRDRNNSLLGELSDLFEIDDTSKWYRFNII
jgi:hypothetical protein